MTATIRIVERLVEAMRRGDPSRAEQIDAWRRVANATRIEGALPIVFDVEELSERLYVVMRVPDAREGSTGQTIAVNRGVPLPERGFETDDEKIDFMLDQAVWMYRHEAREQITHGGTRVRVPHEDHLAHR